MAVPVDPIARAVSDTDGVPRPWWFVPAALALMAVVCLGGLELGARLFWRIGYQLSFRHPNHPLYAFYPELKAIDAVEPRRGDGFYNILMLGGSVLHHAWGEVEPALLEQLYGAGLHNVRLFNVAAPAHTSRDSWLKYAALDRARFDLVILYDGGNEARTNNVPPELFRDDYSHYSWYAAVNAVAPYQGSAVFALPYTLRYAAASARQTLAPGRFAPTHDPRPEWVEYGRNRRSVAVFAHNVSASVALASERHDPLMLMTFALDVPDNYSREAFDQKRLDYRMHRMPVETLGRREYVVATIAAQNEVVRRVASDHKDLLFVDQQALMQGSARNFDDPFHLTIDGSIAFAQHIADALRLHLQSQ
jgi:hypothetical protein